MIRRLSILFSIVIMAIMLSCSSPGGKISPDSKTEECEWELNEALYTFSTSMGLPYNVSSEDATTIFDTGEIAKSYGRDGYQYTVYFGLETGDEGCELVFYKRHKSGPGETSTTYADYGSVLLTKCTCE